MGRLPKSQLLDLIVQSVSDGGRLVLVEDSSHPFVLRVQSGTGFLRVRIYIWNITHGGGRARASNEYRIQVTGVEKFDTSGVDRTLILGWWEEGGVFGSWDVNHHLGTLGFSPSFQIQEECLRKGVLEQLGTQEKGNNEIAVSFSPSFIGDYIEQRDFIHRLGTSKSDLKTFEKVVSDPSSIETFLKTVPSEPRKTEMRTVAQKLRDASFRDRVLRAYGHSCSMCGVQLRLIDAAHIIPAAKVNNDLTSNGIALCSLHHRAFDRSFISMDEKYRVVVNPDVLDDLKSKSLDGGYEKFRKNLRSILSIPPSKSDRPHPDWIKEGNRLRGWKKYRLVS